MTGTPTVYRQPDELDFVGQHVGEQMCPQEATHEGSLGTSTRPRSERDLP